MSSLIVRKLVLNNMNRVVLPSTHTTFNKLYPTNVYIQKRQVCFPLVMIGGGLAYFCMNQMWNPYFDRTLLNTLSYYSFAMTFIGLVIPS